MGQCLGGEAAWWTERLDEVVTAVKEAEMAHWADEGDAKVAAIEAALETSHQSWLSYREAECAYVKAQNEGTNFGPASGATCELQVTSDRVLSLLRRLDFLSR